MKKFLIVMMGAAILTTEEPPAEVIPPAETPPVDDLSTLFTAEDIASRKESLAQTAAEETRRAALTDEQRSEEDTARAAEAAKSQVPEEYKFDLPEGMTLDPDLLAEFGPLAKELKLPQGEAQKMVDLGSKLVQKTIDGMMTAHQERVGNWLKEAEADPEIGADIKLGKESAAVRAFNSLATDKTKQMVDELGIGNHPEFLRVFYKISQHMREDTFSLPGTGGAAQTFDEKLAARFPKTK